MSSSHAPIAALGAAAVLALAIGGSTIAQSPSAPVSPPSAPAGSLAAAGSPAVPAGPAVPVAVGPIEWKIVTKGKDFTTAPAVYGVGQLPDGRLVVVGSTTKGSSQPTGAAWVSADGSKWTRLKGLKAPKGSFVIATANLGTTTVATGAAGDGTGLVWTSVDGTTWTKAAPMSGVIYDLTATPAGLIGVGIDGGAATVWTSADGTTWQATPLAPSGRALHAMAGASGALVATGVVTDAAGDATPVIWSSVDGMTWTQQILDGLKPGRWSTPAAAVTPAGFVATYVEPGQDGSITHVWASPDGIAWSETHVDEDGSLSAAGAAGTDAMLIGHGQVVRSPDGVTWTPTKAKTFDGWTVRDVMTLANGQLLAAGDAGYPSSVMATWTGTAEPAP